MKKYMDLTEEEPMFQGGFIWDYIDQSIYKKDRYGKEFQAYGGDFDDHPCDYNFSGNGIVYGGERDASPKMQEVKFCYQNISIDVQKDKADVYKRQAQNGMAKSIRTLISGKKYADIHCGIKFTGSNMGYGEQIYTFPYFCAFLLKRYLAGVDEKAFLEGAYSKDSHISAGDEMN